MSVTLKEILDRKISIESSLLEQLRELQIKSGCVITGITLHHDHAIGRSPFVREVDIRVELPKQ